MRSVGTRTSTLTASGTPGGGLTRGPSLPPTSTSARRRLDDRSYSAERPPHSSNASGTTNTAAPGDERGYGNAEGSYYGRGTEKPPSQLEGTERSAALTNANRHLTNGERMVANAAFLNGGGGGGRRDGGHHERGQTTDAVMGPGTTSVDICGNSVALNNDKNSSHQQQMTTHYTDNPTAKVDNHNNPPNILPVSGKLEQVRGMWSGVYLVGSWGIKLG